MAEDWLEEVAELMQVVNDRGDIEFLELVKGDMHIRFSRGGPMTAGSAPFAAAEPAVSARAPSVAPGGEANLSAPAATPTPSHQMRVPDEQPGTVLVRSPMVGTFYRASEPGVPAFVEVGTNVDPDSTMALVEAMKVYTSVVSGVAGVVEEIFAENTGFVEFEQPLFRIRLGPA